MAISLILAGRGLAEAVRPAPAFELAGGRYGEAPPRHRPLAAGLALAIAAGTGALLISGLVLPDRLPPHSGILITRQIPVPPQPEPIDEIKPPRDNPMASPPIDQVTTVPPVLPPITSAQGPVTDYIDLPPINPGPVTGSGTGTIIDPIIERTAPVLHGPRRDPGFDSAFQPGYPAAQQREGVEGSCRVSVSISAAGRVTAVRPVDCPEPAFLRATTRQALSRWRYEPATRDGVAVASELTQTVQFRINE